MLDSNCRRDDTDRQRFLETLGEACAKTDWQVHAYCLMENHFHLVLETPGANLVAGMKWFLGTYTSRFNRRHKLFGHLFSGRYKSLVLDGSGDAGKVRIARRLRTETTMTLAWIARRLAMGTAGHVTNRLCRVKNRGRTRPDDLFK